MSEPTPVPLSTCDENLPLLSIMRQFDFGQFVFLHQKQREILPFPGRRGRPVQVVVDPSGGKYQAYNDWLERVQKIELEHPERAPKTKLAGPATDPLGGVSLHHLFDDRTPGASGPAEFRVAVAELTDVIRQETIVHDGVQFDLQLDAATVGALVNGDPALVLAKAKDGAAQPFMTQLTPEMPDLRLDENDVDGLLASGEVKNNGQVARVQMSATVTAALLGGQPVVVRANGDPRQLIRLRPPEKALSPAVTTVVVENLAEFLAQPQVSAVDGRPVTLGLSAAEVKELRAVGSTTVVVSGTRITVVDQRRRDGYQNGGTGPTWSTLRAAPVSAPWPVASGTVRPTTLVVANGVGAALDRAGVARVVSPIGLPVAVFMPWRQTWVLSGFSRGELRSSLALAPQEETTIEVSSWERRLRTLDQSSTTDVDQSFESTQTSRETDDVFQELTKRHDFAWQIEGAVDATYSTGNGSITVSAGGQVSDTSQLQSISRTTQQRMKESTQKAAARIRSVRTTHIVDSVEAGGQSRVTRQIRNPNFTHTLTLDFFETLAHYTVTLAAVPERLTLVALLPNPMATKDFNRELVRRNETALRRALLDSSLVDGFAACRNTRAYEKAIDVITEQAMMGAQTDAATDDRGNGIKQDTDAKQATPQERAVREVLTQIAAAYLSVSTGANCINAMGHIPKDEGISDTERADSQHWLFLRLCGKYLPGLISAISKVPAVPSVANAGALVAVIPPPGAATTLANLNDKSDSEKEQAGLGPQIGDIVGRVNWNWSTGRCREEALYTSNDGGLAGLVDRLQRVYEAYLTKQAEGELATENEVVISKTNAQQDKLSTADKLSMAFPLDELAADREREETLIAHLNEHKDHYSFALFQGLSPAEQTAYIEAASGGSLEVGMFEPRVIAINGAQLAVPLAPAPAGALRAFVENLRKSFKEAFSGTADNPDEFIFPTPGLTINSRLGTCTTAEDFIEDSRKIELRRLAALADSAEHEASRRAARIEKGDLADPDVEAAAVRVSIDQPA